MTLKDAPILSWRFARGSCPEVLAESVVHRHLVCESHGDIVGEPNDPEPFMVTGRVFAANDAAQGRKVIFRAHLVFV